MDYEIYPCSKELHPFVQHFWILDIGKDDLPYYQQVLPYGRLELYFLIEEPQDFSKTNATSGSANVRAGLSGLTDELQEVIYSKPVRVLGISLQPWSGRFLFNLPANELVNQSPVNLEQDSITYVAEQLAKNHSTLNALAVFETFLKSRIPFYTGDEMIQFIAQRILKSDGDEKSIQNLNPFSSLSRRRVEQRFLASVGVSMGTFSRITRIEKAFQLIAEDTHTKLTELGIDLGYYDQSHFIREFKQYASESPKSFARRIDGLNEVEKRLALY